MSDWMIGPPAAIGALGPRIVLKDEPGGRAFLYALHFRPAVARILYAAAATAPPLLDNEMVVTEGWRPYDPGRPTSIHPRYGAFDLRITSIVAFTDEGRMRAAVEWQRRLTRKLGDDYDVVLKWAPPHLHAEYQPRSITLAAIAEA